MFSLDQAIKTIHLDAKPLQRPQPWPTDRQSHSVNMPLNIHRVLSVTNFYQLAIGTTLHRYSATFGQYRVSYWAIVNLLVVHALYWLCLWTHWRKPQDVQLVRFFSTLLYDCVYAHLNVGIVSYLIISLEYRKYLAFRQKVVHLASENAAIDRSADVERASSNGRRPQTPEAAAERPRSKLASAWACGRRWWTRGSSGDGGGGALLELFVYHKMWINTIVLLTLVVYTLAHIDLTRLTLTKVLLILGLALPHMWLANCLRFYTVHAMVVNTLWMDENARMRVATVAPGDSAAAADPKSNDITMADFVNGITDSTQKCARNDTTRLARIRQHLATIDVYRSVYDELNRVVHLQLSVLIKKNAIVLFVVVHVYVKLRLLWHQVLNELDQHLLRVNVATFVVLILNDYVNLLAVSLICDREVEQTKSILFGWLENSRHEETLRTVWNYVLRFKDYRYGGMRLFMLFRLNAPNFLMFVLVQAICLALVGLYQYFNIKIDEM